ncbi:hypothetical protein RhoFasGS6_02846 [Rhodococcus fascians]|nr:hypothetical protein [Rhodococcus fascians]
MQARPAGFVPVRLAVVRLRRGWRRRHRRRIRGRGIGPVVHGSVRRWRAVPRRRCSRQRCVIRRRCRGVAEGISTALRRRRRRDCAAGWFCRFRSARRARCVRDRRCERRHESELPVPDGLSLRVGRRVSRGRREGDPRRQTVTFGHRRRDRCGYRVVCRPIPVRPACVCPQGSEVRASAPTSSCRSATCDRV